MTRTQFVMLLAKDHDRGWHQKVTEGCPGCIARYSGVDRLLAERAFRQRWEKR